MNKGYSLQLNRSDEINTAGGTGLCFSGAGLPPGECLRLIITFASNMSDQMFCRVHLKKEKHCWLICSEIQVGYHYYRGAYVKLPINQNRNL